jgi:endonuclease/exonuclease/phosphatase family metal-dependent hydrolase
VSAGAVRLLGWNLFHGRDCAPGEGLHTLRSRLLRRTEHGVSHAQVNTDLFEQFATVLAEAEWDVAILQECPPRWAERLGVRCRAETHLVLTSRNLPHPLRAAQGLLARFNPDLIASWEGGCNLTLVRGRHGAPLVSERRMLTLATVPETRRMAFTTLRESGLCIANLHASQTGDAARSEVLIAAATATAWAAGRPLVFGGDLNIRPATSAATFAALERDHGLAPPTAPGAIDHLLARDLDVIAPPAEWAPRRREAPDPTAPAGTRALPIRLSDHAPVEAVFGFRA